MHSVLIIAEFIKVPDNREAGKRMVLYCYDLTRNENVIDVIYNRLPVKTSSFVSLQLKKYKISILTFRFNHVHSRLSFCTIPFVQYVSHHSEPHPTQHSSQGVSAHQYQKYFRS